MTIDFFTTSALANEFRATLVGGRVQHIAQMTPLSFGFEIYAHQERHYLVADANPPTARIHLQAHKPRRGDGKETPLLQLFRKYLLGSILEQLEQPPFERLLLLHFSNKEGKSKLVIELLGNRTNLFFLSAQDNILAVARPAPGKGRHSRVLLPGHPYTLPPAQEKLNPLTLTDERMSNLLQNASPTARLSKTLVKALAGLSPLIATEIVYRAYEQTDLTVAQADDLYPLLETIEQVYAHLQHGQWYPQIVKEDERISAFAPLALTHLSGAETVGSISEAVAVYYAQQPARPRDGDGYTAARLPVRQQIEKGQARLARRLNRLEADAIKVEEIERYKQYGEAILAYSYQIKTGQKEISVAWTDDETLTIPLDPTLSAPDNAQKYFARYQKAKRAGEIIPKQRRKIKLQQEYLAQLALDLEMAETRPEIDAIASALQEAGFGKKQSTAKKQKKSTAGRPRQFSSPDDFTVWVGRNAMQNHQLTFGLAAPNDIWLHARGVPGSHVVISTAQGEPPESTLLWAAGLAAFHSKARSEAEVTVSYTRKKHVRSLKGAPPGLVSLRKEQTLSAAPLNPEDVNRKP